MLPAEVVADGDWGLEVFGEGKGLAEGKVREEVVVDTWGRWVSVTSKWRRRGKGGGSGEGEGEGQRTWEAAVDVIGQRRGGEGICRQTHTFPLKLRCVFCNIHVRT